MTAEAALRHIAALQQKGNEVGTDIQADQRIQQGS
jgi:hypothetical protein